MSRKVATLAPGERVAVFRLEKINLAGFAVRWAPANGSGPGTEERIS